MKADEDKLKAIKAEQMTLKKVKFQRDQRERAAVEEAVRNSVLQSSLKKEKTAQS